jgi:hypothetical protein
MSDHGSPGDALAAAVRAALPGWRMTSPLRGFGLAPEQHLRTCFEAGAAVYPAVVRRSHTDAIHEKLLFLHRAVFPRLAVRTPALWAALETDEGSSLWTVLEDLGQHEPQPGRPEHRAAVYQALAHLSWERSSPRRDGCTGRLTSTTVSGFRGEASAMAGSSEASGGFGRIRDRAMARNSVRWCPTWHGG